MAPSLPDLAIGRRKALLVTSKKSPSSQSAPLPANKVPKPQPGIDKITLYTPGQSPAQTKNARRLSSNENLYGPSPKAIHAVQMAANSLWQYPSTDHFSLREAIAARHNLPIENLICAGMGSDEILYSIAQAYAGIDDEIIMTEHGFEVYGIAAYTAGAKLIIAPETERRVNIDAIIQALTNRTKIIYIANPANPTGTMLSNDELARLADQIPSSVLLVIDSAYAEFAHDYDGGASLVMSHENIIMTRTFSKLYGLGGLRIGWALAPLPIIDTLNRMRIPFNLSAPALAGAEAAMRDCEYTSEVLNKILENREFLRNALLMLNLQVDPSSTNFLLVRFKSEALAIESYEKLYQSGFITRKVGHYGFANALRITIGTRDDCEQVLAILREMIK